MSELPQVQAPARHIAWLMERSTDATMLTDPQGRIEYVNPACEPLPGWPRQEVLGRTPALLKSGAQQPDLYRQLWATVGAGREFRGVLVNRRRNGELYHEEKSIRPLFDGEGRVTHLLSCGRDVSERVAAMAQLRHSATHDALTGLPNRALFMERTAAAIARARQDGTGFAVVLVDVDAFKRINDQHGHAAGDAVLQAFAERMQQCVRKADTVARLGGDEFALLLEGSGDERQAASLLAVIARALTQPVVYGEAGLPVSASLGACVDVRGELDLPHLLEQADEAMYEAKRGGGGWRIARGDRPTLSAPLGIAHGGESGSEARPAAPLWRTRSVQAGDALLRAGQRLSNLYVLREGRVAVVRPGEGDGAVQERDPQAWLGLDGISTRRHRCDVIARSDAELWAIDYDQLLAAAREQPELLALFIDALAQEAAR